MSEMKAETVRLLWRENNTGDELFTNEHGGLGISVGGYVIIKPLRDWHALARQSLSAPDLEKKALIEIALLPPSAETKEARQIAMTALDWYQLDDVAPPTPSPVEPSPNHIEDVRDMVADGDEGLIERLEHAGRIWDNEEAREAAARLREMQAQIARSKAERDAAIADNERQRGEIRNLRCALDRITKFVGRLDGETYNPSEALRDIARAALHPTEEKGSE